jgi:hypothetical protein
MLFALLGSPTVFDQKNWNMPTKVSIARKVQGRQLLYQLRGQNSHRADIHDPKQLQLM